MTTRVPNRRVGHLTSPNYSAGNSDHGDQWYVKHGFVWTDDDMLPSKAVRGVRTAMNTHYPMLRHDGYVPYKDRRRVSDLTPKELKLLQTPQGFRIRTVLECLNGAHRLGLKRELEAKAVFTLKELRIIALHARLLWGDDWTDYVNLKCLTTTYRWRRILRRGHAVGFPTIALVRGRLAHRQINAPYITYVRGSFVI